MDTLKSLEPRIVRGLPPQLKSSVGFMLFNVAWTFLAGEVTGNVSQVDRIWTFLPPIYTALYTFYPLFGSAPMGLKHQGVQPRAVLMTALQVLWSVRLSYNTARRGLFSLKEEDYRWAVFRAKVPKWAMSVFNLLFIALVQNILLFMLGLPAYTASVKPIPLGLDDYILSALILGTLAIEFTADNQQWAYHQYKKNGVLDLQNEWPGARIEFTEEDRQRGFITKGLWSYSRHPNAAAEQFFWFLQSLFPLLIAPHLATNLVDFLAVLTPSISLSLLIFSSTIFTESISTPKYPAYAAAYKKRVGMFWPTDTLRKAIWLKVIKGDGKKVEVERAIWGIKSDVGVDGARAIEAKGKED